MASIACEVSIWVYLLPADVIWPNTVTAKIAATIQKRGPRKILLPVLAGFFEVFLLEKLFFVGFLGFCACDISGDSRF